MRLWLPNARGESTELGGALGRGALRILLARFSPAHHRVGRQDGQGVVPPIGALPLHALGPLQLGALRALLADSRLGVSGGDDKLVKLWDVATHRCIHTFYDHASNVNQVLFSGDGTCVASCSADRTIKIWDARSYQLLQHYPAHTDVVTSIALHPSGNYLLSSSADATLKLWDLREGQLLYTLHGHHGAATATAFTSGGDYFASGGADRVVMIWRSNLDQLERGISAMATDSAPIDLRATGTGGAARTAAPRAGLRPRRAAATCASPSSRSAAHRRCRVRQTSSGPARAAAALGSQQAWEGAPE